MCSSDLVERLRAREAEYQKAGRDLDKNVIYNKIQADLAADLESLATIGSELQDEIKTTVEKQTNSRRGERLAKMKRDFASRALQIKVLEDRLNQEIGSVKNTAKQFAGASLDLEFRRAKLEQITQIHDELQAKILAFNTEQRAPERVSLFKESTVPVQPSELIPWKKITFGGTIAFFALEESLKPLLNQVSPNWGEHWPIVFGPMLVMVGLYARGRIDSLLGRNGCPSS